MPSVVFLLNKCATPPTNIQRMQLLPLVNKKPLLLHDENNHMKSQIVD